MPRVLIPSDNRDFVAMLARAYQAKGWDVVVGQLNFDLAGGAFDLVHLQWPEELSGWKPPTEARTAEIIKSLETWKTRSRLLLTVHNLYPHRYQGDPAFKRLFSEIYKRVPVLAHFTEASHKLLCVEFPEASEQKYAVTGFFNFDSLVPAKRDRAGARKKFGFSEEDFVVLSFGALREWAEVVLVRDAFSDVEMRQKRLLMAGRYQEFGMVWQQRWRRWSWSRWLGSVSAVVEPGFIPDAEVHRFADAADVVIVPRVHALNSGLPALAASFGLPFVAPDSGPFAEIAAGTKNQLYIPGDPFSLARAIERTSQLDRATMAEENRALAASWSWDKIVTAGIEAVGLS